MKKNLSLITFIVLQLFLPSLYAQEGTGRITQDILKAVVKIATSSGTAGTGFLVSQEANINGVSNRRVFLITNKHMLGDWNLADGNPLNYHNSIDVFFYRANDPSGLSYKPTRIELKKTSGQLKEGKVFFHPDPKIDIALVATDEEISSDNNIDFISFDKTYLLNFNKITSWLIGLGDQVFAIGYPLGITSLKNNYPIVKSGYVASLPGEEFSIDVPVINRRGDRVIARVQGKILLVDGLLVPGNSGGPVILASELKVRRDPKTNQLQFATTQTKNYVIGIVSSGLGPSGLTVVYSSDYIQDLVEQYLKDGTKR